MESHYGKIGNTVSRGKPVHLPLKHGVCKYVVISTQKLSLRGHLKSIEISVTNHSTNNPTIKARYSNLIFMTIAWFMTFIYDFFV